MSTQNFQERGARLCRTPGNLRSQGRDRTATGNIGGVRRIQVSTNQRLQLASSRGIPKRVGGVPCQIFEALLERFEE
jgi:hypothetical protein